MFDNTDRRMTRAEAAHFLTSRGFKVAVATLGKYATLGGGPRYSKFGRKPLYTAADLLEWATSRTTAPRQHTSEKNSQKMKPVSFYNRNNPDE